MGISVPPRSNHDRSDPARMRLCRPSQRPYNQLFGSLLNPAALL